MRKVMINVMLLIIGIGLSRIYFLIFGYFKQVLWYRRGNWDYFIDALFISYFSHPTNFNYFKENQRIIKLRIIIWIRLCKKIFVMTVPKYLF